MARSLFTSVPLEGDLQEILTRVPATAGVAKILDERDHPLLIGRPANLRKWTGSHLGLARHRPGKRPPTNLLPVARAVAYVRTSSEFHQRLVYERAVALVVPAKERRDLKPPVYLHVDPDERFPRVTIRGGGDRSCLFGPFRQRPAAEKAVRFLHRLFPLRPCDFVFEPDPRLPLGLGCVYAQVRTCAAPCLARVTEESYRDLARQLREFLATPERRPREAEAPIPPWVAVEMGRRAVVVEAGKTSLELYPVYEGTVLEQARVDGSLDAVDDAAARLSWTPADEAPDDRAWLSAWLHLPKRRGLYLVAPQGSSELELGKAVREALGRRQSGPPVRGVIT